MTTQNAGEKEQGMSEGPYKVERTAVIGPRHSAECGSVVVAELVCRCSNTAHRNATDAAARRVRELERENEALHAMFDKVATADKRTPLTMNDATIITIGTEDWIVPNQIAAEFRRLTALAGKERSDGAE